MKTALTFFLSIVLPFVPVRASLRDYPKLVVSDPPSRSGQTPRLPSRGVRITYLGTNGCVLESRGATVVIDPYLTRLGIFSPAFNLRARPSEERIKRGLEHIPRRVDAMVITHGHFDHLLDAPHIAAATGAVLIGSQSSVWIAEASGLNSRQTRAVKPGDDWKRRGIRIRVLRASHDRLFGRIPFDRHLAAPPPPPRRVADWVCGEPLAYLIEMGGQRIYVDSGGTTAAPPPSNLGRIDLAILGVALPDSRKRLGAALANLRPRYFLPSHQDNFFRPLDRGFSFNWLTSFPFVQREAARHPAQLILLDYFMPWTLL